MYQALYRKYRPLVFDEVVGQQVIVRTLKNAILNNRLSHAYLFTGPRGTGKTTIAKILAKTINCYHLDGFMPCNECVSCTQINNKQSTDIIEIDAASNNGVDEIREIRNKVNLVPSSSKYKVYIIDEVHMLTVGAFNALLKTLEEPPSHVIFILATTEPHKIPITILSRCQRFDFKKVPNSEMIERLNFISQKEKIDIDAESLKEIADLSDGCMRDAISLLDQISAYAGNTVRISDVYEVDGSISKEQLTELLISILNNDIAYFVTRIDEYSASGKNITKVIEKMIILLKNTLLFKSIPDYFDSTDDIFTYEKISSQMSVPVLTNLIEILNDTVTKTKQSNMPAIIFELSLIEYVSGKNNSSNKKVLCVEEKSDTGKERNNNNFPGNNLKKNCSNNKDKTNDSVVTNELLKNKLNLLKDIRINNTLAAFNKKALMELRKKLTEMDDMILMPECSHLVSFMLDGNLKAASEDHMIFVYDSSNLADYFNENLLAIEQILEQKLNKHFSLIATDMNDWEIIKKSFNTKTRNFVLKDENIDLMNLYSVKNEKNEISDLFGEIIEVVN